MDRVGLKYLTLGKISNADGARSFCSISFDGRFVEGAAWTMTRTRM